MCFERYKYYTISLTFLVGREEFGVPCTRDHINRPYAELLLLFEILKIFLKMVVFQTHAWSFLLHKRKNRNF